MSQSATSTAKVQKDSKSTFDFHKRFNLHASTAIRNADPKDASAPIVGLTFWMKDKVQTKRIWLNKSFACITEDQFNRIVQILNEGKDHKIEVPYMRPKKSSE